MLVFSAFDMSWNIFPYLVRKKVKVSSDAWLLKKQTCVFGLIDPESWQILGPKKLNSRWQLKILTPKLFFSIYPKSNMLFFNL